MKSIIYCISILILFLISSCKKSFLDVIDKSNSITRQGYVVNLATTSDFLNGAYVDLEARILGGYNFIYPEVIADNVKPVTIGSTTSPMILHYTWSLTPTSASSPALSTYWRYCYEIARSCSFVIEKATEYATENTLLANDLKGQAYSLRAFSHFLLVNIFAQAFNFTSDASHPGVPYVTTYDIADPVSRQSVAEDYNRIISDLENATQILPNTPTTVSASNKNFVFNKNAVKALLARVYLFKGDFLSAKKMARQVIDLVPLMPASMSGYPSKLFTSQETEALFQLPPAWLGAGAGAHQTTFAGVYFATPNYQLIGTSDIAGLIREFPQDVRNSWVTSSSGNWNITKFPTGLIATGFPAPTYAYYQTILRSSEMYLTASESYAQINNEDSARFYLNAIRNRANLSSLSNSITGSALVDSIYKERRKELAFEGLRMFDLLRWKKGVNRADAPVPTAKTLSYPSSKAIAPIPQTEVDLAQLQQNAGY